MARNWWSRLRRRRGHVLCITSAILFCLSTACIPEAAGKNWTHSSTGITFPDKIGSLTRAEIAEFPHKELGTALRYSGPDGVTADVFIYDMGTSKIPDGPESEVVKEQLQLAAKNVASMVQHGRYASVKEQKEEVVQLGKVETGWNALSKCFVIEVASREWKKSYLLVTGYRNQFLKIRYTYPLKDEARGDELFRQFVSELGTCLK
jgi:hypothetical protein